MAKKSKAKAAKKVAKGAKTAKKSARKTARATRTSSRTGSRKSSRQAARPTRKAAKKGGKQSSQKAPRRSAPARKTAKATKPAGRTGKGPATQKTRRRTESRGATATGKRPNLDRERRTVREEEELFPSPPSSLNMDRTASAARTGRAEYEQKLRNHTSTGPAMTGGDVDADWEDAESVGEEAPGGDNPTPDQDVVDEIGRAVGIEYEDDEELQGGDELSERDRHRWELDPRSKEDVDEEE